MALMSAQLFQRYADQVEQVKTGKWRWRQPKRDETTHQIAMDIEEVSDDEKDESPSFPAADE